MSDKEAWCQLVSLTDFESDPLHISTDRFSIGRAFDCDLCLSENRLISGHHCFIQRETDGSVSLTDTSTNGTILNLKDKITKGKSKTLCHGDEFYLVYKKSDPELNVGYIFQDLEELKKEESTQEYSPSNMLDATLEDSDCNYVSPEKSSKKRKSDDEDIDDTTAKKAKVEEFDKDAKEKKKLETASDVPKGVAIKEKESGKKDSKEFETGRSTLNESKEGIIEEKGCAKEDSKHFKETKDGDTSSAVKAKIEERDDIEENLQCMICQEIMHDCISLQPCLHSFCSGCYSDWMSRSQECPSCRKKVERINKNHIVNNLIEAYLKEHPSKRRPKEDIEDLNKKNKITHDMLYPKDQLKNDSSDYSDTDGDEDDDDDASGPPAFVPPPYIAPAPAPVLFGFGTPVFGVTRAFKTVCRQCSEYKEPADGGVLGGIKNAFNTVKNIITGDGNTNAAAGTPKKDEEPSTSEKSREPGTGEEPSTSGEATGSGEPAVPKPSTADDGEKTFKDDPKVMPTPPNNVCTPNQNHVLCQCCLQPFPDFRFGGGGPAGDPRPAACGICYRAYCHAYWGCRKADCLGCLNKFKEMNFGRKALAGLILDNQFESEIFKDYIDSKGLSVKDVLQECCNEMEAGRFSVQAQGTHRLTSETPVCYACGLTSFKQLAFQYRKTLKKEDLPTKALNRPDCYWGSKCRTQRNKPHHARNFNHICDQTRQF